MGRNERRIEQLENRVVQTTPLRVVRLVTDGDRPIPDFRPDLLQIVRRIVDPAGVQI